MRVRLNRRVGTLLLMLAGFIFFAGAAAVAYFTVNVQYAATNYATAAATSLSPPTTPTLTEGANTLTVGWTLPASQLPGAQYQVTRSDSPTPFCTVASAATSCTDSALTAGATYTYSVAAVLGSWQSTTIATAPFAVLGVSTTSLPSGTYNGAYTATLGAAGGASPYTWSLSAGTLPPWASLNASTGEITGTPTVAATTSGLVFTVTDSATSTATSAALSLVVGQDSTTTTTPEFLTSVVYGSESSVVFTASVTANLGEAVPDADTITVSVDSGAATCTITLPGTTCAITDNALPAGGPYAVTATFNGDANLSTSSALAATGLTVTQLQPTLTASGTAGAATGTVIPASSITAVLEGGSAPSGTISFAVFGPQGSPPTTCTSGGTSVGTATVAGNGSYHPTAGFTVPANGTYWWYASYNGDINHGAATSVCPSTSVDVGGSPSYVAVNPTTNKVYAPVGPADVVTVFDGATNVVTATVDVGAGSNPHGIAVNPATNKIYVADKDSGSVSVIDGATDTVTDTITGFVTPKFVAADPSTNKVYVSNNDGDAVSVIDGSSDAIEATITTAAGPGALAVNPAAHTLYVTDDFAATLTVIDTFTNTVVTTVDLPTNDGGRNFFVAVNPTTGTVYTADWNTQVSRVDGSICNASTVSGCAVTATGLTTGFFGLAVNPTTNVVYAVHQSSGRVYAIDGATGAQLGSTPDAVVDHGQGLALNPATGVVYASNVGGSTVGVVMSHTVARDTTTTTVSESPTTVAYGNESTVTFTAGVTANLGGPVADGDTITVSVNGGAAICTVTLPATTCTIPDTALPAGGPYAVVATFNGDANLSGSSGSAATGLTVTP